MPYEQKPNTGSYFRNDKKEIERHPDVKGSIKIECPQCRALFEMWQSGWNNTSKDGTKQYVSQSFQVKEEKRVENAMNDDYNTATGDSGTTEVNPFPTPQQPPNTPQGTQNPPIGDSDIPF